MGALFTWGINLTCVFQLGVQRALTPLTQAPVPELDVYKGRDGGCHRPFPMGVCALGGLARSICFIAHLPRRVEAWALNHSHFPLQSRHVRQRQAARRQRRTVVCRFATSAPHRRGGAPEDV